MNHKPIYLDNNATTAIDPLVLDAMVEVMRMGATNPSSVHILGQRANSLLCEARRAISDYLGVKPRELLFTSGGTEGANLFIRGFCTTECQGHIISSEIEHSAVYKTIQAMEKTGWTVTYLPAGQAGAVSAESLEEAIRPETKLIALMAVNNETGVKTDLEAIATLAAVRNIAFFVDGVAWLGKEPLTLPPGVSAATFSAHKFHGPLGTGLLVLRQAISPQLTGGAQEFGRRAGTENLPGIVGLAKAIGLLRTELPKATQTMTSLRDRFEQGIREECADVEINGSGPRICNTSNLMFEGVDGESLLIALDQIGIAASHGSACSSGALEPSRILLKMGFPLERANSSLRFSLSRLTTEDEIDRAVELICQQATKLRASSFR